MSKNVKYLVYQAYIQMILYIHVQFVEKYAMPII